MTYIHLKERRFYEGIYDRSTVEWGRRHQASYEDAVKEMRSKFPDEDPERPGNIFLVNILYMSLVGNDLLSRYEKREEYINQSMAKDEAKDEQLAGARLTTEPVCQHCDKTGLRITDKSLMHRGENHNYDDPEEVLFVLKCTHCQKNSAYWEDGSDWERRHTKCPKCRAVMEEKSSRSVKAITTTYTCPSCSHSYKDKLDLSRKKEKPDPDYEEDRKYYCLEDDEFRKRLQDMRQQLEQMARLGKEYKEREDNKHIYDAIKEMKKPKIAELMPLLSEPLEKAGYIEFHLDQPDMGRDVYVCFSCLDSKSDRDDYESRKTLKKLVDTALKDTNWRLMSDGISYRLGYLNGRVRAYEGEEHLKDLVTRSMKLKKNPESIHATDEKNKYTVKDRKGRKLIM